MSDENVDVVETVPVTQEELIAKIAALPTDTSKDPVDLPDFLDSDVPAQSTPEEMEALRAEVVAAKVVLDAELTKGDLVVVDIVEEVAAGAAFDAAIAEINAGPPSDDAVQAVLEVIAPGAYFRTRCTLGVVTDTFVVGGPFAPGRQRWVQTQTNDSAQKQAEVIRDALIG